MNKKSTKKITFLIMVGSIIALLPYLSVAMAQVQRTVNLQTDVQEYLDFSITAGGTVTFGNLVPGTPIAAPATGTVTSVTTNAANGYTISLNDNVPGNNSALVKGGLYIPDFTGTIAAPAIWVNGTSIGLGATLYSCATPAHKDAKWGAGVSFNDALNNYAGIPETTTVANTITGYHAAADVCNWAFKLDVSPVQEAGVYSGPVTFTATAVLL